MGSFEISFMFRTGQRRSVLMYAADTARFHYISLSLFDGALHLKVCTWRNAPAKNTNSSKLIKSE